MDISEVYIGQELKIEEEINHLPIYQLYEE